LENINKSLKKYIYKIAGLKRKFKGCSPLQLLCNLTGNRPQSATFHTAKRYAKLKKHKTIRNE